MSKKIKYGLILFAFALGPPEIKAQPNIPSLAQWTEGESIDPSGRANPYGLAEGDLIRDQRAGQIHTQSYPVKVTGFLPPFEPIRKLLENDTQNPLKYFLFSVFREFSQMKNFTDITRWLGLHDYPTVENLEAPYAIPYPEGVKPDYQVGFSFIERDGARGFTFSCAACHSAELFGRTVLGMTNRFPKANTAFDLVHKALSWTNKSAFKLYTNPSPAEMELFSQMKSSIRRIGVKTPLVLGLDTALAQVSLSLNRRNPDEMATPNPNYEKKPRADWLDQNPADSKPAVWWNVKYKNRWLSDGSVVSGNPIFTNIIWNEIGRGTDLQILQKWFNENQQAVQQLTTAVFSTEAPRITDFFPEESISIVSAKNGEKLFASNCARCHGNYEKGWSQPGSETWNRSAQLKTTRVVYFAKTRVMNVGTDPLRAQGMNSLEKLNDLQISQLQGIVIKSQQGYVPPPLVGIWARWPYFHNNSVPSLCAVLTKAADRPKKYWSGEAHNPQTDFDFNCNGYPLGDQVPSNWKQKAYEYDASRLGLSNQGHDEGVFLNAGQEIYSPQEKQDIISFLQTL